MYIGINYKLKKIFDFPYRLMVFQRLLILIIRNHLIKKDFPIICNLKLNLRRIMDFND